MSSKNPNQNIPAPSIEEMVSDAMNEQGFLFSQAVQATVQFQPPTKISPPAWEYVEREYPVTASDGSQTRIDLVLRNAYQRGAYATLECKRANPLYKRWMFFDEHRGAPNGPLYFEVIKVGDRRPNSSTTPGDPQFITTANHQIITRPSDALCPVFHSYLEVAINREKRAGHTQTVEEAFEQVMKGHTGLMSKIIGFDQDFFMCSIPVVVTTAEIFRADFIIKDVPLNNGKIAPNNLTVTRIDFCAVSFHPNDNLSIKSKHIKGTPTNIRDDLAYTQRRTVFIVRGDRIEYFLSWLNSKVEGLHL